MATTIHFITCAEYLPPPINIRYLFVIRVGCFLLKW